MPLDINQSDKAFKRIVCKANKQPGNKFLPGITKNAWHTNKLNQDEYLYGCFYFPVDSYIWNAGAEFTAGVAMKNIESDYENANGFLFYGMQFFSTRDLPFGMGADQTGNAGRTPFLPDQKETKNPRGDTIEWDAWASATKGIPIAPIVNEGVQIPTYSEGWTNKSARMQLAFGTMSTGNPSKKVNINFTKKVRKRGRRKARERGFDVPAGTKLVWWMLNKSGGLDSESEVICNTGITPRLAFVPKQDILQRNIYSDQSMDRWNESMTMIASTDAGDGINAFWSDPQVQTFKDNN